MMAYFGAGKMGMFGIFVTRILRATGHIYGAKLLLEHALIAQLKVEELGEKHHEFPYYAGKVASAKFFIYNILPEVFSISRIIKEGDLSVMAIPEESFLTT